MEQFRFVIYEEDIKPDGEKLATANRLFEYLDVAPMEEIPGLLDRSNRRLDSALAHLNQYGFFRENRYGQKIRDRINRVVPKSVQDRLKITVEQEDLDALREFFEPHSRAFEAMIGRKLPW